MPKYLTMGDDGSMRWTDENGETTLCITPEDEADTIFKTAEDVNKFFNPVNPSHYETKSMRCKDIIKVMVEGLTPQEAVDMANIIKYLYRFKYKDGMKDLKKADEYLTFLMEDTEVGE